MDAFFLCRPIGAVIYVQPGYEGTETQFKVSLRSIGESADTTKISQVFLHLFVVCQIVQSLNCYYLAGATFDITKIQLAEYYLLYLIQAYGGGGHRNASSFLISREELERWKS